MEKLLPDRLKELWQSVERKQLLAEEFSIEQERLLTGYRRVWSDALRIEGHQDLRESLLYELGLYTGCTDLAEIRLRCKRAVEDLADEWRQKVDPGDRRSVERFYDETQAEVYELMWWHSLEEDLSPLSYVTALHFARARGCRSCLDFGSGVGTGSIVFAHHGLSVALADISSPLLAFSRWRFRMRRLRGEFFDLKTHDLPSATFDVVTAMDVFEHLVDPVEGVEKLWKVLTPGGFLFGRFHAEPNEARPLHIVRDFGPTLRRLVELGFAQVWGDEWLWGHQAFQKT